MLDLPNVIPDDGNASLFPPGLIYVFLSILRSSTIMFFGVIIIFWGFGLVGLSRTNRQDLMGLTGVLVGIALVFHGVLSLVN